MASPTTFGLIRERLIRERRVALTPAGAEQLIAAGHIVLLENSAGDDAGFSDDDYRAVGANVFMSAREVIQASEVFVKLHVPNTEELEWLREGGTLTGFLHLFSESETRLREIIREQKMNAVSFELLEENANYRPVLEAVSAIGGRVAILLATQHMLGSAGGIGRLLGGAPGVPPLGVVVIGAGAAGEAAAREAHRMGARVSVLDQNPRALARISRRLPGVTTAPASGPVLDDAIANADLLLCAVAMPGRPAPRIVNRRQVRSMPQGAMIIDMSVDEGGCCETTRPSADEGIYIEEGVRHLCVPNLPAEVARTASTAFTNSILPYLLAMGNMGIQEAVGTEPALYKAAVYIEGRLRNSTIAELTGEPLG